MMMQEALSFYFILWFRASLRSERPVVRLGQLALGLPYGAAAVLRVQVLCAACFLLVLALFEKLVLQHCGKWTCEKNIPKLLHSVLRQPIVGIVRPLNSVITCSVSLWDKLWF